MKRRAFLAAIAASTGSAALGTLTVARAQATTAPSTIPPVNASGLRTALAAERGKVVVLNLWASWCVPCLREIPDLVRIERELAPRGAVLIGVSMDEPGDAARVATFHAKYFPEFRSYLRTEREIDAIASVVDPAWNEVLPTTYLLGRDGKVVRRVQGAKTLEQFRALIESAL